MSGPRSRYGAVARLFHWTVVVGLAIQIPAGIAMIAEGFRQETTDALFVLHKGLGSVLLVLIVARLAWRLLHPAPPMPESIPALERRIAGATHWAIYGLLLLAATSGYVRVVGGGFPIELLDRLGIPALLPEMPRVAPIASIVHRFVAFGLVALVAAHVGAVARHSWIEKDGIMGRIWPPLGGSPPPRGDVGVGGGDETEPEREPASV